MPYISYPALSSMVALVAIISFSYFPVSFCLRAGIGHQEPSVSASQQTEALSEGSFIEESTEDEAACCTGDSCYGRNCCPGHRKYNNGFGTSKCIPRSNSKTEDLTQGSFIEEAAEDESACCKGDSCYGRNCCPGHRKYNNGFGTSKCIPRSNSKTEFVHGGGRLACVCLSPKKKSKIEDRGLTAGFFHRGGCEGNRNVCTA
eukprot:TRINITY_DN9717_c0_g1_i3.p2 TRINITY_DN9717_c0_g1~~TRINITY_DN9717_c0_g1_i3.p2  ORF type:complete len:202 (-),score=25.19 TRINITY_DN9717_c0_g1_i3:51-656(-)